MNAVRNKEGFSLVEVLVAMVVLLVSSLALMQTALVSIEANMGNALREEAVNVAEMRMNEARSTLHSSLQSDAADVIVNRNLKKIDSFPYTTRRIVTDLGSNNAQVEVTVNWSWKGKDYVHKINTIIRDEEVK
jgi:type IV pilus assembly protein PilV